MSENNPNPLFDVTPELKPIECEFVICYGGDGGDFYR